MRRTKIVATIGPASRDPETLARMVEAGLDVARLNFSHGNRELHAENAERVRAAASAAGRQVAILQDLPGPKLRIGTLRDDIAELKPGERLVLVCGSTELGNERRMSVSWGGLADAVDPEDVIYLADGAIRLRVKRVRGRRRRDRHRGRDRRHRRLPAGPQHPRLDARPGRRARGGPRHAALRRVDRRRRGGAVVRAHAPRTSNAVREHTRLPLIAKIEKPQAVDDAEEIIRAADTVMVARGDLGIELPIEDVPIVQKQLLGSPAGWRGRRSPPPRCSTRWSPHPRPTRAEVADVANAILDGTDAVMLSQETAIGAYPVEAVEMMAAVAERTERVLPYRDWNEKRVRRDARDPAYTIAYSACAAARPAPGRAGRCPPCRGARPG